MKNKKLYTRLFALLASLVLVLALALPCFAEDTEQPTTDYIYKRVYNYDDAVSLFDGELNDLPCVVSDQYITFNYAVGRIYYNSQSNSASISWEFPSDGTIYLCYLLIKADSLSLTITYTDSSGASNTDSSQIAWGDIVLYVLVPASSTPTDPTTPSSDMYSNLFNILKDAVYGSDAELTGSQEYALTLISTILTYATILLPVILVIFIAVWCFKRF